MPPKKRALAESDSNAQPAPKRNQKAKQSEKEQPVEEQPVEEHSDDSEHDEGAAKVKELDKDFYQYICFDATPWCKKSDDDDDEDDDEDDEEEEGGNNEKPEKMHLKSAADHPKWKWVMLWKTWSMLADWNRLATYTNPDCFDMYIYNDFHWYGLAELLENLLAEFEKAKNKHAKAADKKKSLLEMWAPLATLAHWISQDENSAFQMMDDGERSSKLIGLLGSAYVAMLDTIDKEGQLKENGEIKDLGLVISLCLKFATGQEDYGIEEDDLTWAPILVAYAKKAGIDLVATGCGDTASLLEEHEDVSAEDVKGAAKRVNWTNTLRDYKKSHTEGMGKKLGGDRYNIMKMSRTERASYAFDKKDPLAQFSLKDLREGNLMIG